MNIYKKKTLQRKNKFSYLNWLNHTSLSTGIPYGLIKTCVKRAQTKPNIGNKYRKQSMHKMYVYRVQKCQINVVSYYQVLQLVNVPHPFLLTQAWIACESMAGPVFRRLSCWYKSFSQSGRAFWTMYRAISVERKTSFLAI